MKPTNSKRTLTIVNHCRALDILDQAKRRPMTLDELSFLAGNLIGPIDLESALAEESKPGSWLVERMKDTNLDGQLARRAQSLLC